MQNILIVSSKENAVTHIVPLVREAFSVGCNISTIKSGMELRRAIANCHYDFVIINCPLSDEFGAEPAVLIAQTNHLTGCVLLVKSEQADQVQKMVENEGIVVVSKPINRQIFYQVVKFINVTLNRIHGIATENEKLQGKIEEIRLVNRAKLLLMQYLGFDESQAHRYIEKRAMDTRSTRKEVAMQIIKTYEV